jgi:hypothetical protein
MLSQAKFHHRHNKYGGHDSICLACLMTVACVEHEWELAYLESVHVCDPINLYWMSQGRVSALVLDQAVAAHCLRAGTENNAAGDKRLRECTDE